MTHTQTLMTQCIVLNVVCMCIPLQARRFITLVDELYEHGTLFLCTAEAPALQLFKAISQSDDNAQQHQRQQHTASTEAFPDTQGTYIINTEHGITLSDIGLHARRIANAEGLVLCLKSV
jgi:AFG1-like ATPase